MLTSRCPVSRSRACALAITVSLLAACSVPSNDEASLLESQATGVLSCRAKREAAAQKVQQTPAASHWRYLLLGVMQPVAGVPSIRERLDLAPDNDPLARRLDAFAFAKSAAGPDGLLSLERLVAVMGTKHGVALGLDRFQTDGSYAGPPASMSLESGVDFRATLWLAKYVFAVATTGVTAADVAADAERARQARDGWKTVTLPISNPDGYGSTLDQLVAESEAGTGRVHCGTWGGRHLKSLARAADAKYGNDDKTSLSEMAIYASEAYGATITLDPWTVTYGPSGPSSDAMNAKMAFDCALNSLLYVAAAERAGVPSTVSPGVALGMTRCDPIDLLALQGHGSRYTGSIATKTMGDKQYEIVMLSASVLKEPVRKLLCLDANDELKLYVRYGEATITECGVVNGLYTAAKQGLTGYGYTDNWASQ